MIAVRIMAAVMLVRPTMLQKTMPMMSKLAAAALAPASVMRLVMHANVIPTVDAIAAIKITKNAFVPDAA